MGFKPGLKILINLLSDTWDSVHGFILLDLVCMRPCDGFGARAAYHHWQSLASLVLGSSGMKITNISILAWRTLGRGSGIKLKLAKELREKASRKSFAKECQKTLGAKAPCKNI